MSEPLEAYRLAPQQRQLGSAAPAGALPRAVAWVETPGVDVDALARAVDLLTERHEALRTVFQRPAGLRQPVQQVLARGAALEVLAQDLSPEARQRALEDRWTAWRRPQPIEDAQPAQVLVAPGATGATLLLSAPALGLDGHGLAVWIEALAGALRGVDPEEPELQYGQFADWQNAVVEQLVEDGAPTDLEAVPRLVLETAATEVAWTETQSTETRLAGDTVAGLESLARSLGVGVDRVVLTAWRLLLDRHGLAPGAPVALAIDGREFADELHDGLGRLLTSYPLEVDLPSALRFGDAIRRVSQAVDALAEDGIPLEAGLERLAARSETLPPAFVAYRPPADTARTALGWRVERWGVDDLAGRCRLEVLCESTDVTLTLAHPPALLNDLAAQCWLAQLAALVGRAVANHDTALADLEHGAAEERQEALAAASGGASAQTDRRQPGPPVHQQIATRVQADPETVALEVVGGARDGATLSYEQLWAQARRLAARLRQHGLGPEDRVAVLTGRSPELLVAVLAVLEAGAAYVPLDPADPESRLGWVLDDAAPGLVLASAQHAARLADRDVEVWTVDLEAAVDSADATESTTAPAARINALNAAYVIYTSGSTGRPKGVVVSHGALANYLAWCGEQYPVGPGCSVALHSPVSFDLAVTSILAPLAEGGRVVLVAEDPTAGDVLTETLGRRGFDLLKLTPGHLRAVLDVLPAERRSVLANTVVLGGEPLAGEAVAALRRANPDVRLINEYGPTEATVGCVVHELPAGRVAEGPVAIGQPIPGARIYGLDGGLEPVPAGSVGELHLGGTILARGYLGRPGATAERFVPDPHADTPGARMYTSGDLVHSVPGLGWVHRGRNDEQLKVRGVRIEPGEVEAALERLPAVQQAVAGSHQGRLAAWILPSPDAAEDLAGDDFLATLESHARDTLPPALVPSLWAVVDALPLAESGKLDRRGLPEPRPRGSEGGVFSPPTTAAERTLAEIWQQILGVERVGVDDSFFQVGGDSITSAQVVYRARQAGLELSVRQLVQHPTLGALAAVARPIEAAAEVDDEPTGLAPLTPIQRWFFDLELPRPDHWNQALWLASDTALDPERVRGAIERLVRRHPMLSTRFERGDTGVEQRVEVSDTPPSFDVLDLSATPPGERPAARLALAERLQRGLDLASGRLLRAAWVPGGDGEPWRLLLVVHHLVVDGVSWRLLLEDLARDLTNTEPAPVTPQGPSYRRWATALETHAKTPESRGELDFWRQQLPMAGERLPLDPSDEVATEASCDRVVESLDTTTTRDLLERAPAAYRSNVEDLLVTALVSTLVDWRETTERAAGSSGLVVELEGHGREALFDDLDPSTTVGWFTTLFPCRLEIGRRQDPGERLKAIKERLRAIPRRGIGFGLLRYLGSPEDQAHLAAMVPPEVGFNYLGRLEDGAAGSLRVLSEPVGTPRDGDGVRHQALTVTAGVVGGQLEVTWTFSQHRFEPATVVHLAASYRSNLRQLVEHCLAVEAGGATPSDFPEAGLDQGALDDFFSEMETVD